MGVTEVTARNVNSMANEDNGLYTALAGGYAPPIRKALERMEATERDEDRERVQAPPVGVFQTKRMGS